MKSGIREERIYTLAVSFEANTFDVYILVKVEV